MGSYRKSTTSLVRACDDRVIFVVCFGFVVHFRFVYGYFRFVYGFLIKSKLIAKEQLRPYDNVVAIGCHVGVQKDHVVVYSLVCIVQMGVSRWICIHLL